MPAEHKSDEVSSVNETLTLVTNVSQIDNINESSNIAGLGASLLNSSPPPHSYRHTRAYRHFKNPPQPHMCIRTTTETGEELFINVLSWTRIVIPQEPSDPIPLYGGMRVLPGSSRSPPIVFAVMANPEVLKDSGRHSKDPEERHAMVELMCDFVEAMNPGVKLVRNAIILKDRDISGELKDVWNAVQAQRDREREEQLVQQRQQQHYNNVTTHQMFPKSVESTQVIVRRTGDENQTLLINNDISDFDKIKQTPDSLKHNRKQGKGEHEENLSDCCDAIEVNEITDNTVSANASEIQLIGNHNNVKVTLHKESVNLDQTDGINLKLRETEYKKKCDSKNEAVLSSGDNYKTIMNLSPPMSNEMISRLASSATITSATAAESSISSVPASTTGINYNTAPPVKKDKLGGFLPNGCIFPRFKNSKHKDKEREKDIKSRDKEKSLLNALKKNKDKKIAVGDQQKNRFEVSALETEKKLQYEKNFLNLESEVQKLNLNKIDSNNENVFIKVKVSASSTVAK